MLIQSLETTKSNVISALQFFCISVIGPRWKVFGWFEGGLSVVSKFGDDEKIQLYCSSFCIAVFFCFCIFDSLS